MSRSIKKPYYTYQNKNNSVSKLAKRYANRVVRKSKEVSNGKAYRKESDSWSIRDWAFYCPKDKKAYRK